MKKYLDLFKKTSLNLNQRNKQLQPVTVFSTDTKPYQQLQLSDGAKVILPKIKAADTAAMIHLLNSQINFNEHKMEHNPLIFTDLGSGEGMMLDSLLITGAWLLVNANEPHKESLEKYRRKIRTLYAEGKPVKEGQFINYKTEDEKFNIPSSHLILASHSLYYNVQQWRQTGLKLSEHLLTKLISSLKHKGVMCVILQSGNKNQSLQLAINEEVEEHVYPLIFQTTKDTLKSNKERLSATNAEEFERVMEKYANQLKKETNLNLNITSEFTITTISLGDVNFSLNPKTGFYDQSADVTRLFMFYTRNLYCKINPEQEKAFTPEQQKRFLDFIQSYCRTHTGHYVINHVNKVFLITLSAPLNFSDLQLTQANKEPDQSICR